MNKGFAGILIILGIFIVIAAAGYYVWDQGLISNAPLLSPSPAPVVEDCVITGCSGQVCADEDVITTCEYREEYACYKSALCERQPSGQCGWTETTELQECLNG